MTAVAIAAAIGLPGAEGAAATLRHTAALHGDRSSAAVRIHRRLPTAFAPLVQRFPRPAASAGGATSSTAPLSVAVSADEIGRPLPKGFLGFSIEYPAVPRYLGTDPNVVDPVFLHLVEALNPTGSPVLRVGGNSTDETWWPVAGIRRPATVDYTLTPNWLSVTRAMATDLGARLILGVNLADDNVRLARAEADAFVQRIGRARLAALEVGNEPDLYGVSARRSPDGTASFARPSSWDFTDYLRQFGQWVAAFPTGVGVAGPAFALPGWMSQLGRLLRHAPRLTEATFHRYPLRACDRNPSNPSYPSIANLLADSSSAGLAESIAGFVATAHAAGRRFRLDELNSASCTGRRGVSNTFTSSLWALDTLIDLAAVGVDGVNIHTLPGAAYEPFTFAEHGGHWTASVKPIYYGLLAFARAFPTGARLLSVRAPAGAVKAYATQALGGVTHVVLINKSSGSSTKVHLTLAGAQTPLAIERLTAPALTATRGVTLGGEGFGSSTSTGRLASSAGCGATPSTEPSCSVSVLGRYTISLPAGSAVLLTRSSPG